MMPRCSPNGRRRRPSAKTGRRVARQLCRQHLSVLLLGLVGTGILVHIADGYGWCSDTWSWRGRQQAKDGTRWPTDDGMVITYINGIYHSEAEWATITQKLEDMFRHEVRPFYNPSSGWWITDASKAWYHLLRRPANASVVQGLGQHLAEAVKDVGRGRVLHIAHSGGALITYLAAQHHLNPRQRDKIDVLTFGGARSLTRKYFSGRVVNYYARNDPLVMLDRRAAELMRLSNDSTFDAVNDKHNSSFVFLEGLARHFVQDHSLEGPTYQHALNREAKAFRRSHFGPLSSHGWDYESSPLRLVRKQAAQLSGQHRFFSNAAESWHSLRKEAARLTGIRGFFSGKLFQRKDLPGVEVVVGKDEPIEPADVSSPPSRNTTLYVETLKASIARAITWSRWRRTGDGYNRTVGRGSEPESVASSKSLVPETLRAESEEGFLTRGMRWIPGASSTGGRVRSFLSPDPQGETHVTDEDEQEIIQSYPYPRAWNAWRFSRRNGSDAASGAIPMASNGSIRVTKESGARVCPPDGEVSGTGPIEGDIEVRPPPDGEGKPWFSIGWLSWSASRGADPNGTPVPRVRVANLATSDAGEEEAFDGVELISVEDDDDDNDDDDEQPVEQPATRLTRWWSASPAASPTKSTWWTAEDKANRIVAEHGGSGQGPDLSTWDEDRVSEMIAERDLDRTTTAEPASSGIHSISVGSSGASGSDSSALGWGSASTMERAQILVRRLWPSASDRDPVAGTDGQALPIDGEITTATALSTSREADREAGNQHAIVSPLATSVEALNEQEDEGIVNSLGDNGKQQSPGGSRGTDTTGVSSSYSRLWASLTGARKPPSEGSSEDGVPHAGKGDNDGPLSPPTGHDGGGTQQVGGALGDVEVEHLSGELMLGEQLRREGSGMTVEIGVSREVVKAKEGFGEVELDMALGERVGLEEDDLAEYEHDTGVGEWTSVRDITAQLDHKQYDDADLTSVDLYDVESFLEQEPDEDVDNAGVSRGDDGERGESPEGDAEFVDGAEANETVAADEKQRRWDTASAR